MYRGKRVVAAVIVSLGLVACNEGNNPGQAETVAPASAGENKADAKADALAKAEAAAALREAGGPSVKGLSVVDAAVTLAEDHLEVQGKMVNDTGKAVGGVNLVLTFVDSDGRTVGGHSSQQFFSPALPAGESQQLVVRVQTLGGTLGKASAVSVRAANLIEPGGSPDGWKPLDPKNMPAPVVVGEKTVVNSVTGQAPKDGGG